MGQVNADHLDTQANADRMSTATITTTAAPSPSASSSLPPLTASRTPPIPTPRTIVIKLGTSSICSDVTFAPNLSSLALLVETIVLLRSRNFHVVLVSSGAVGTGLRRLGMRKRPKSLGERQAVAAVGQGRLMALYDELFGHFGVAIAQVLLTRDCLKEVCLVFSEGSATTLMRVAEGRTLLFLSRKSATVRLEFSSSSRQARRFPFSLSSCEGFSRISRPAIQTPQRSHYLNARTTFRHLLKLNVVPIVNENDTVSSSELRFGDNDTLSAITAGMVNAECLFLLTDVPCLYTANPRLHPDATPIRLVRNVAELRTTCSVDAGGSDLGTGGMVTKLVAADLAAAAGVRTVITLGSDPAAIPSILEEMARHASSQGDRDVLPTVGTHFLPRPNALLDRKWWILHGLSAVGTLQLDAGAVHALTRPHRSSLFAAGIVNVKGDFSANQSVHLTTIVVDRATGAETEVEIGTGLVNYTSVEIARIKGRKSGEIEALLGYVDSGCVVHRENLVVTDRAVDVDAIVHKGRSTTGDAVSPASSDGNSVDEMSGI
ncbi:hypothetical protein HKX48_007078 [Thoreauomyces humboldtii]|nr:hypothetical protein HKX48_007078 [Thoreauomyces humboldtii]